MSYEKLFDPPRVATLGDHGDRKAGDVRDGSIYVYGGRTILAVNVALAAERPLLVCGPPGSGKSSLAPAVARFMDWRFEEKVISTRTEARDLLWTFDALRRLRDAQADQLKDDRVYTHPELLWRALDPVKAADYGPRQENQESPDTRRAVVLLDEIDKADPDVPNDLLVPLGSFTFDVPEIPETVTLEVEPPLLVLTTNDERELSRPFVRRCVVLRLNPPTPVQLVEIARSHYPDGPEGLFKAVAEKMSDFDGADGTESGLVASTAEYLDAVEVCMHLKVTPESEEWKHISEATLSKRAAAGP